MFFFGDLGVFVTQNCIFLLEEERAVIFESLEDEGDVFVDQVPGFEVVVHLRVYGRRLQVDFAQKSGDVHLLHLHVFAWKLTKNPLFTPNTSTKKSF